ncbi:MAG: hypothetical protein EKK57_08815 [Proteobacteria bacterium]|nr:MAG: hypothetical protein EKK57_08815 [Pseudomonadota bacterium]
MTKKEQNLKIAKPETAAGGVRSLTNAAQHIWHKSDMLTGIKAVKSMNKIGGFDCPGCAWPTAPEEALAVEICENGIKALAEEITTGHANSEFFAAHSLQELQQMDDYHLGMAGRLTEPMIIRAGDTHYQAISWNDAFDLIASELSTLEDKEQAAFYTSGRTSNEAAFLYQLMVRMYGTNNLPDSADLCHEASGIALSETIGVGKGTVTVNDFSKADAIFIFGQNPGSNHPRMLKALQKAAANGCKIVSINPLIEAGLMRFKNPQHLSGIIGNGSALSDLLLQVKINGDMALISAMIKMVFEIAESRPQVINQQFIDEATQGFAAFKDSIVQLDLNELIAASGVEEKLIREAAEIFCNSKRVIACWAMGLTQHHDGVATIQQLVNLLLLGGHVGREGAGVCPVRGHSNVQGDKTMGITENPPAYLLKNLSEKFNFSAPTKVGMDTISVINGLNAGTMKILVALGGNLLMASPDTHNTARALQNAELTVHIATKLNHTHLYPGKVSLILPCLARSEKDYQKSGEQLVTVENSMGIVHRSSGVLEPCSDKLLSEVAIVANLATRLLPNSPVNWLELVDDYASIRDLISDVIPGFQDFNHKINSDGWFYLYNAVRDERKFVTKTGKANFTPHTVSNRELAADEFLLMTTRSHDQFNTTVSGMNDRYRGIKGGRMILFMNPEDIKDNGLSDGAEVTVSNAKYPDMQLSNLRIVSYDIPRKCLASYFPEANVLIPLDSLDMRSRTPTSKSIVVKIS